MKARREGDRTPYICVLFQMLCDWLILTWHLSLTLERAIKPLSEGLIERSTQIAHIWGCNEGWNNESNIVFTYIYDFHFLKSMVVFGKIQISPFCFFRWSFDLRVWWTPLLKYCHFTLATKTKLNCVSALQVCLTFRAFFSEKSLSEEMRWGERFNIHKDIELLPWVDSWVWRPLRFRLLTLFLYLFPFSRLCPEM